MKNLFKNCLTVIERDGWLTPLRFTEKQLDIYSKVDVTEIRSMAPSSVCLAFHSAAKTISFEYRIGKKARNWASFDVVVGDVLYKSTALTEDSGSLTLSLSGNEELETLIYLPSLVCIEIKNITADAPLIPTEKKKKTWLALGDSITQGMVAKKPSFSYVSLLSRYFDCEVINAGVGGIVFNAEELDYIGKEPDLITVALGCNDWGDCDGEALIQKVTDYVDKLLSIYKCRNIYAIIPIWRSDADSLKADMTFGEHREFIRRAYEKYPFIKIIDGYELVPKDFDFYGDDDRTQVHPNDLGFLYYSEALIKRLGLGNKL